MILESAQKDKFYDPFRRKWLKSTPEELVRQSVLRWLTSAGGYDAQQISIEKSCRSSATSTRINRRLDIAIYLKDRHGALRVGAVIECKAHSLKEESLKQAMRQVMGYQWHSHPLVIVVACENGAWHYCQAEPQIWKEGIPSKLQLLNYLN